MEYSISANVSDDFLALKAVRRVLDRLTTHLDWIIQIEHARDLEASYREDRDIKPIGLSIIFSVADIAIKVHIGFEPERFDELAQGKLDLAELAVGFETSSTRVALTSEDMIDEGTCVWSGGVSDSELRMVAVSGFDNDLMDDVVAAMLLAAWGAELEELHPTVLEHRQRGHDFIQAD